MIRRFAKGWATALAIVLSAPAAAAYHLLASRMNSGREVLFQSLTQFMSLTPSLPGDYHRHGFLWMTARRRALNHRCASGRSSRASRW